MKTNAIKADSLNAVLRLLTPANRLVCLVALATGLRVADVLNIKTENLNKEKFTVTEFKTGKHKTIRLPQALRNRVARQAGHVYAFEGRLSGRKPRTRQAVWKDLHRVAGLLRLRGVAPHSMRKSYARGLRAEGFTEAQIQKALNHTSPYITYLYSMADEVGLK